MKKETLIIVVFLLVTYPLVVTAAYLTQHAVIFHSRGASLKPPRHLDIKEMVLHTPDGERLYAWWQKTEKATKTVLYFQENGRNISFRTQRLHTFQKMGVNALLIDYRGYGKSTGKVKKEQDIYIDGLTAWYYLTRDRKIAPKDIIIWGRSLGGGVAAEIAQFKPVSAVILESTFASLGEIARRQYWYFPTQWMLKFHFDNRSKLQNVKSPVVIIHSTEDNYIPFGQATKLFTASPQPKYFIETKGSHYDLFDHQGSALVELMEFLRL